jgi:hypothetical protein
VTQHRAVFTVTVETKPDGDYYFDHDDFVRHVIPWIEGGLDDRDDIRGVTIAEAAVSSAPATDRAALRELVAEALLDHLSRTADIRPGRAAELEDEVKSLTEASRRLLEQRQEMAAERFAWQERGDRAEARVRELEAGRAAVLEEVAAWFEQDGRMVLQFFGHQVAAELRRMAAETPRAETQTDVLRLSEEICPGFPDRCPNLRTIEPEVGVHLGGVRCGCADETPPCANCGKPVRLITGTLATWWVHDPGGHTICDPQQAATSPRATPADPAQPAKEADRG